jgi:excisionase family DNA binding protein
MELARMQPTNESVSGLLTVAESAALLRLKASTVRAWILHRKIAYVKLGGRVFLRKSDCDALITASFVPAREDRRAL